MKIVKQYNDYACVLACLESYLTDKGFVATQKELLARYPQHCHAGEDIQGAFAFSQQSIQEVGRDYRFTADLTLRFEPSSDRDFFIVTTTGDKHCVRVRSYLGGTRFEVMDPNINRNNSTEEYAIFDFTQEAHRDPAFLQITQIG